MHENKYRIAGKKSLGQEYWGRTVGMGKSGQDSEDRTDRTRQPENVGMIQAGQEREDMMARV
jgi:hypothetical protein